MYKVRRRLTSLEYRCSGCNILTFTAVPIHRPNKYGILRWSNIPCALCETLNTVTENSDVQTKYR